jgi:tetratricopeptide (TPR) repeat protein
LEAEHPNLWAALGWSQREETGSEAAFRLAVALGQFWSFRCSFSEGRQQLAPLLAMIGARPPTAAQAKLLHLAGVLARRQGDYEAARALLEQCLTIGRELEEFQVVSDALADLGGVAKLRGDYAAARSLLAESLVAAREAGYKAGIAQSLEELGRLAHREGKLEEAYSLSTESLAMAQQLKDLSQIATSLQNLGEISCFRGDYARARAFLQQSLEIYQRLGARKGAGYALGTLGLIALAEGDPQAARSLFRKGLHLHWDTRDKDGIATSLEEMAALSAREGRPDRSAQFLGAAAALREAIAAACGAVSRIEYEHQVATFRGSLGELGNGRAQWPGSEFLAAWSEGRTMTLEQSVAEAMDETRAPPGG